MTNESVQYDNNWAQACINISRQSGKAKLLILDECPSYEDCLGMAFGPAIVDCEGICGGLSHYGDINGDQRLDVEDRDNYIDFINSGAQATSCNDLDGNGSLTVYDIALLDECLLSYDENVTDHNHCIFPKEINSSQTAELLIEKWDKSNKTITIKLSKH